MFFFTCKGRERVSHSCSTAEKQCQLTSLGKLIQLPHAVPRLPVESNLCGTLLLSTCHRDLGNRQMNIDSGLDTHICRVRSHDLLALPTGVEHHAHNGLYGTDSTGFPTQSGTALDPEGIFCPLSGFQVGERFLLFAPLLLSSARNPGCATRPSCGCAVGFIELVVEAGQAFFSNVVQRVEVFVIDVFVFLISFFLITAAFLRILFEPFCEFLFSNIFIEFKRLPACALPRKVRRRLVVIEGRGADEAELRSFGEATGGVRMPCFLDSQHGSPETSFSLAVGTGPVAGGEAFPSVPASRS
ncbi:hypothetical protein BWQ96_10703 [Gracilariopsis chorda]|uniref:Uncharacterized protein n=1 Tax=Gracilariopsis chorda TaxID=448386 RepID=A0A2V3IBW6_9FLOR|nr:hypothetical protein BWQ96_10703 [Gracilariopsis chorda]|eukprot:PXF39602.1 hypothetical protein BWQ96_10703 [Gracilariopsis chorda]